MADKSTFIKLDRNITRWRWFTDGNTLKVWIWLLINANIEDYDFLGETIHRGQLATSRKSIAAGAGLTERQARTALEHLKKSGEVSVKLRPKYQVITVQNYDLYQSKKSGKTSGKSPAEVRQKSGGSPQLKNIRTPNGEESKNIYMGAPTFSEVEQYVRAEGLELDIQSFLDYNTAMGWDRVKDWRALVRLRAKQLADSKPQNNDDNLDDFGRPIMRRE